MFIYSTTAKVVPIYKKGDPKLLSNYRPISLLSSISKIFERLVHDRLDKFIVKNNILYSDQYGFRKNYSTYMAALNLVDRISNGLDSKRTTAALFIDLSKAFDTIDHDILSDKLFAYAVRGTSHQWLMSYLKDRPQYVHFGNCPSKTSSINIGVPQGSILGPLLFILYINDIPNSSLRSNFILFADDTTIYCQNSNLTDTLSDMTSEFKHISNWLRINRLSLNMLKTKLMIYDNRISDTSEVSITLDGHKIDASPHATFLGITIDENLNWGVHIGNVSTQISRTNGIINRLKSVLPRNTLLLLYNALVLPYLNYSLLLWGRTNLTYLNKLYILQKRVIRNICDAQYNCNTAPLFHELKVLTLFDLYDYQLGIFVYKFTAGMLPDVFTNLYMENSAYHSYGTRHRHHFSHPYSRTIRNSTHIRTTGVYLWNSLDHELRSAPSLYLFKKKYKLHLLNR